MFKRMLPPATITKEIFERAVKKMGVDRKLFSEQAITKLKIYGEYGIQPDRPVDLKAIAILKKCFFTAY